MIRHMKHGEENNVKTLLAKLSYEDQVFWRKQTKTLEEYVAEASTIPISEKISGENVILVAEENDAIVGFCWCTIVDRGVDKQGEIAEFYVEKEYQGKGIGKELIEAAKKLFIDGYVTVAFVWTRHGNEAALSLYKNAGFKEVTQLVMAFVPPKENTT